MGLVLTYPRGTLNEQEVLGLGCWEESDLPEHPLLWSWAAPVEATQVVERIDRHGETRAYAQNLHLGLFAELPLAYRDAPVLLARFHVVKSELPHHHVPAAENHQVARAPSHSPSGP